MARPRMIVLELNEADRHFLDRYASSLPMFERMRREGALVTTRVPGFVPGEGRDWRAITPWIIWPTLYTGMLPEAHGVVAFGQDTSALQGRCVWDVLDAEGLSVGVMGSLLSWPPRGRPAFYVPERLADDDACVPERLRPLQRFLVESSRGYSEDPGPLAAAARALDLARSVGAGVRPTTALRVLGQIPRELAVGAQEGAERAVLQADVVRDAFVALVRERSPDFACVHSNHVAYMQHRYWRAAEPGRFARGLSDTDARYFRSERDLVLWETRLSDRVRGAFVHADRTLAQLAELLDPEGVLVVVTALGQRPFDPVRGEIDNPVVRLERADELFDAAGIPPRTVKHQMNPDLSLTFDDEAGAILGQQRAAELSSRGRPLFFVQRRGRQVFLELELPRDPLTARVEDGRGLSIPLARHVALSPIPDQSTAQHRDEGVLLAWSPRRRLAARHAEIGVDEVAPTLLSFFGVGPRPWMREGARVAVA